MLHLIAEAYKRNTQGTGTNRTAAQKNRLEETLKIPSQEGVKEIEISKDVANTIWDILKKYDEGNITNSEKIGKYLLLHLQNPINYSLEGLISIDTSLGFSKEYDNYLREDTGIICINKRDLIDDGEGVYYYTSEGIEKKLRMIGEKSDNELSSGNKIFKSKVYTFEDLEGEKIYIHYNPRSVGQIYISRDTKEINANL